MLYHRHWKIPFIRLSVSLRATVHSLWWNGEALPGQRRGLCIYAAVQSSCTETNGIFGLVCPVYLFHGSHLCSCFSHCGFTMDQNCCMDWL